MVETETYMKQFSEKMFESELVTKSYGNEKVGRWLCEKKLKMEENEKSPFAEFHCHLTDNFRGLAQRKWNLRKRK